MAVAADELAQERDMQERCICDDGADFRVAQLQLLGQADGLRE